MSTSTVKELLNQLTDAQVELLLREYVQRQLDRMRKEDDATEYGCRVLFMMNAYRSDDAQWSVSGLRTIDEHTVRGAILTKTVDSLIRAYRDQRDNKLTDNTTFMNRGN